MRIVFEIRENLPDIINEILKSDKWIATLKEELDGRKTYLIKDPIYNNSEATIEIYDKEVLIQTAWSKYTYRIFPINNIIYCEYTGAYRGLLEQTLLPTITPKDNLLESQVLNSTIFGDEHKKLREYAEINVKLRRLRREQSKENTSTAPFDHPKRVYDEYIKEDIPHSNQIEKFL